jgi:hypothetical protein
MCWGFAIGTHLPTSSISWCGVGDEAAHRFCIGSTLGEWYFLVSTFVLNVDSVVLDAAVRTGLTTPRQGQRYLGAWTGGPRPRSFKSSLYQFYIWETVDRDVIASMNRVVLSS